MKQMKNVFLFTIIILSCSCNNQKPKTDYLGVVNLTVSGEKDALLHFEKGLLLLHSFEYSDAREAFQQAQKSDPKMAMAYWGEAMTHNHSLWGEQDYEKGVATLYEMELNASDQQITELEEDFLEAVQIIYQPQKTKLERDVLYAEFMETLEAKYPDNHEVSAFYALSLLGSVPEGRDDRIYGQGAKIVQGILEENPNHPGALHYLIHSYDDPVHAGMALDAANSYSQVAPDASHALHMPSHIYVALGMWDEVVSSNENSYQASLNRKERKKLGNNGRGYHAYHWLEYGYLQQGRVDDARKMVLDLQGYVEETPSSYARRHLVFLKGTFLNETDLWNDSVADIEIDVSDLNVSVRTQYNVIEGRKAFRSGDKIKLEETIKNIQDDHAKESLLATYKGAQLCSSVSRNEASQMDLDESLIMLEQLLALLAWMDNDKVLTEKHIQNSIALNDKLSYSYGPPFIQKPTNELYADWLVEQNRPEEAIEQYNLTLKKATNRKYAVTGKQKATDIL
jgi:tetratricopeptide (TPR) repeat protein